MEKSPIQIHGRETKKITLKQGEQIKKILGVEKILILAEGGHKGACDGMCSGHVMASYINGLTSDQLMGMGIAIIERASGKKALIKRIPKDHDEDDS